MRPEKKSHLLLGVTRSKAKMLEYGVPLEHHITITQDPAKLFTISIGLLGDLAAAINREDHDPGSISEMRANLLFSARFFDSYLQSKLNETLDPYLVLMGSASYYLCDLPGSASVLAKRIDGGCPDLDCDGLEVLLLWLLQADLRTDFDGTDGPFGEFIDGFSKWILRFFSSGNGEGILLNLSTRLRAAVYQFGTPRQLLFGDVIVAVLRKKLENSVWKALPSYSGLSRDKWLHVLQKDSFIKELWPAQHLLGQAGVLKGKSAIVQMPTSAGKTKATELILRSAFLADRISLAIVIAPFRALCHEIKNSLVDAFRNEQIKVDELSDAIQADFVINELLGHHQILVITPEKLLYVLRHAPELAVHAGLLIFDEGHQFDSGTRGITYELLLTSLRSMIPNDAQKVLISAVINNAKAVGEWLNYSPNVVDGATLIPTFRSVGFASWLDQLGRIEYVDSRDAEQSEFFVPRVIEKFNLGRKKRERNDRYFPEKNDGQAIALYLGQKLVQNGGIAIFCGKKTTAASVCEKAVDIIERGSPLPLPSDHSDTQEVKRLTYLHAKNLGSDAPASKSANFGIFSHHGNTPHGIRLAVEHAMRDNLVRFVVCTSTLAQGVNLPIRYLIVTSVYQGIERIKVRDFHNLVGRAGRAGMHTEGSILFADPVIYDDTQKADSDKWRWNQVKELLDPSNSEPCISNLLSIFDPFKSDDEKRFLHMEALYFAKYYISAPEDIAQLAERIAEEHGNQGFSRDGVERQVVWRMRLICAIESFLLSHLDEKVDGLPESEATRLAEETLAFFLADDQKKLHIRELFMILAKNIFGNITNSEQRKIYGRTLYGLQDAKKIEEWVHLNSDSLISCADGIDALNLVWHIFAVHIKGGMFSKFDNPETLKEVALGWINGNSFDSLLKTIRDRNTKMVWGARKRDFKVEHIVEVCEGSFAYDAALLIGAVCEFIAATNRKGADEAVKRFQVFQKRLKYGLPNGTTIAIYELGLADRVVAQDVANVLQTATSNKKTIIRLLKQRSNEVIQSIHKYPSYFSNIYNQVIS